VKDHLLRLLGALREFIHDEANRIAVQKAICMSNELFHLHIWLAGLDFSIPTVTKTVGKLVYLRNVHSCALCSQSLHT